MLTPNQEVATENQHDPDGCEHEPGPVSVVLITHETDPAHRVSVHLWTTQTEDVR